MSVRELQKQFIMTATAAILIVMAVILGTLNLYNYSRTFLEASRIADYIAGAGGIMPYEVDDAETDFSPEAPYSVRYFTAWADENGEIISANTDRIRSITKEDAREAAFAVTRIPRKHGHIREGRNVLAYSVLQQEDGTFIAVFLDCTSEVRAAFLVMNRSCLLGFLCTAFFAVILWFLSRWALQPVVRNMDTQRQFITNASHELKTPLTIISANTEVLEMMYGESEWTGSIIHQVERMTNLVNSMTSLAKIQERNEVVLTEVDVTGLAREASKSFRPVIEQKYRSLMVNIDEKVTARAETDGVRELFNILLDNAVKYCDEKGVITMTVAHRARDRGARITVSNMYAQGKGVDYSRLFDRFYRVDTSHSSRTQGFGIGLSMAQELTERYKGRITASWKDGVISFTLILP